MSSIVLSGDTSGTVTVAVPAVAGTNTVTIPAVTGTAVVSGQNSAITAATALTASGSSVDFTSVPSWVKRITVILNNISFAAAGTLKIRIGAGSLSTSGYSSIGSVFNNGPAITISSVTDGVSAVSSSSGTTQIIGQAVLTLINTNEWVCAGSFGRITDNLSVITQGSITLGGTLDRVSLVATTSTFDAGTVNIFYE